MAGKIFGLLISIGLIIAGLTGDFVLVGTNSSTALVIAGVIFLIIDIVGIVRASKNNADNQE